MVPALSVALNLNAPTIAGSGLTACYTPEIMDETDRCRGPAPAKKNTPDRVVRSVAICVDPDALT